MSIRFVCSFACVVVLVLLLGSARVSHAATGPGIPVPIYQFEPDPLADDDGDGLPNYLDPDNDDDGVEDELDALPTTPPVPESPTPAPVPMVPDPTAVPTQIPAVQTPSPEATLPAQEKVPEISNDQPAEQPAVVREAPQQAVQVSALPNTGKGVESHTMSGTYITGLLFTGVFAALAARSHSRMQ